LKSPKLQIVGGGPCPENFVYPCNRAYYVLHVSAFNKLLTSTRDQRFRQTYTQLPKRHRELVMGKWILQHEKT